MCKTEDTNIIRIFIRFLKMVYDFDKKICFFKLFYGLNEFHFFEKI